MKNQNIIYHGIKVGEIKYELDLVNRVCTIHNIQTTSPQYFIMFMKEFLANFTQAFMHYPMRQHMDSLSKLGFIPDEDGTIWEWTHFPIGNFKEKE